MIKLFITCLVCISSLSTFSQIPANNTAVSKKIGKYLTEICTVIKQNALYADSIDWKKLEIKISALSRGIRHTEDCQPVIDTILRELKTAGDFHSGFLPKSTMKKMQNHDSKNEGTESRYIDSATGYIKVPGFYSFDLSASESFASDIQDRIMQLDINQNIHSWIVDLRNNRGGNMYPMIKGLSCLIGEGIFAYAINSKQQIPLSTLTGQTIYIKLKTSYSVKTLSFRIAVLIDSLTASSGEFTAIAFKGLPNVKFFGQPSAGYTTSNQTFPLSDGSCLFLATGYMADRNKKIYFPNIIPDVITLVTNKGKDDLTIVEATKWLHER